MNEKREQQMMLGSKAYISEIYDDEPTDFQTKEKIAETIADFCAGWRAADNSRWIHVEKELPKNAEKDYLIIENGCYLIASFDPSDNTWWVGESNIIYSAYPTHWMEIVSPRKEVENET